MRDQGPKRVLQSLERAKKAEKQLGTCSEKKAAGWTCLSIAVDSGACDNVMDPDALPAYADKVVETEASINHHDFVAANGETIPNYGELKIPMVTRERTLRGIAFQVAGVKKALGSVQKMNEAGHIVIFDGPDSFIYNKATQEANMMRQEDGNFIIDVWVPPPSIAANVGFGRQP